MRPAVRAAFHRFSEPLEGRVYHMYLDAVGLVTTGVGNLIDAGRANPTIEEATKAEPPEVALAMPWKHANGTRAPREEIRTAWRMVKLAQGYKLLGGNHPRFRTLTSLRLSDEDVDVIVERKLDQFAGQLRARFASWGEWPADAQLFSLSWAWAVGAAAPYPRMTEHLRGGRFAAAADECTINPQIGTIVVRNRHNGLLLRNAQWVVDMGADPGPLYWPRDLRAEAASSPREPESPSSASSPREPEPSAAATSSIVRPRVPLGRPALDDLDDDD